MYGANKFHPWLKRPVLEKKDSEAPDYGPMAQASAESARIMGQLGQDQLDFAKTQYADLAPYLREIADQQVEIGKQTAAQGQDYYEYQKSFRPVEQQMLSDAMVDRSGEIAKFDRANQRDARALTQSDAALYQQHQGEIGADVDRAIADTQGAYTRNINQAIRQGLRYGSGASGITANVGGMGLAQAQMQAAAANNTRTQGLSNVRQRIAQGLQLRQSNMASKNQQEAIGWAKRLDAAGLVKGMAGASQGAYGLAISSGNAAGQNAQSAGQNYMQGMGQGASTVASGRSMYQQGLGSVLNSQTQMAMNDSGGGLDGLGAVVGAGAKLFALSDRRLKEDIEPVGVDERTGLTLYEFKYIDDDTGARYRGVMADEVEAYMPDAVVLTDAGFQAVDYGMIGIEMEKV